MQIIGLDRYRYWVSADVVGIRYRPILILVSAPIPVSTVNTKHNVNNVMFWNVRMVRATFVLLWLADVISSIGIGTPTADSVRCQHGISLTLADNHIKSRVNVSVSDGHDMSRVYINEKLMISRLSVCLSVCFHFSYTVMLTIQQRQSISHTRTTLTRSRSLNVGQGERHVARESHRSLISTAATRRHTCTSLYVADV